MYEYDEAAFMCVREKAIKSFYQTILGREADLAGLKNYLGSNMPLEFVFASLEASGEAKALKNKLEEQERIAAEDKTLPITLATFVKNSADCIEACINSVKPIVREIVVVDTGSSDDTISICESLGARVYKIDFDGFDGFGNARTITAHLARQPFVFMLDSDETILEEDLEKFKGALDRMNEEDIDIVALPRKRWVELSMETQLEKDVYPDFQLRLFKNKPEIKYIRRIHEIIDGSDKRLELLDGPCIQHFQDSYKTGSKLKERNKQYKDLYNLDIKDGVEHTGRAVEELDER